MLPTLCDSIHSDDLGSAVGMFHDEPVRSYDPVAVQDREVLDMKIRVRTSDHSKDVPPEVLPGELICPDNMIRRDTAAQTQPVVKVEGRKVSIDEARKLAVAGAHIAWRPEWDGTVESDYALVLSEPTIAQAAVA